jgi:hypothetical protein
LFWAIHRKSFLAIALFAGASCSRGRKQGNIEPVYDRDTGKLQLLKYGRNGNGKVDTWSYILPAVDGAVLVLVDFDRGAPDRRLTYAADGSTRLEVDQTGSGQFVPIEDPKAIPGRPRR